MAVSRDSHRLIERDAELDQIDELARGAAAGRGAYVVAEGPAGIGKSALVAAALERGAELGLKCLTARGNPLERDFAFGVCRQLFERELIEADPEARRVLLSGAAALSAGPLGLEGAPVGPALADVSFGPVHGLYWLVCNMSAEQPVLLALDDMQWVDSPTLRFLLYLAHRLEGVACLVLAAARPGELGTDAELGRDLPPPGAAVIRPRPLSEAGVGELVERSWGRVPEDEFTAACRRSTGGNPFLLGELLAALTEERVEPNADGAESVAGASPESIRRSLLSRLAALPDSARALARAAAILADEAQPSLVAALAGVDEAEAVAGLDALVRIQILAPQTPLSFVHDVVRESIYAEIPPVERTAMHGRAAGLLRGRGAAHAAAASHVLAAEPGTQPEFGPIMREAAYEALARGAPEIATRYLERALAEGPVGLELGEVLGELGAAQWLAGEDQDAAITCLRRSVELTEDPAAKSARAILLARAIFWSTDAVSAAAVLAEELDSERYSEEDMIRLEAEYCTVGLLHPETVEAARERLLRIDPERLDETRDVGLLQIASLTPLYWLERPANEGAAVALRSVEDGRLLRAEGCDSIAVYQAAWVLASSDRHDAARATIEATMAEAKRRGSTFGIACSFTMRALIDHLAGEVSGAEASARSAVELPSLPPFARPAASAFLALALVERGDLDEAEWAVSESGAGGELPELVQFLPALQAQVALRLAQGRLDEALESYERVAARNVRHGNRNPIFAARSLAVETLMRMGEEQRAMQIAAAGLEEAERYGTRSALGIAQRSVGLALGADGIDQLRVSVATLAGSPARLEQAKSAYALGAALRRRGKRVEARERLQEALEQARRCGAQALVERSHEDLITAGARPRRLMFSGVESLTASERRVAKLAAEGQTNREIAEELFVTSKTIENHLGRVYNKLEINSRKLLGDALAAGPKAEAG